MNVEKIVVGSLQENCYLITKNGMGLLVDPGDEAEKIIAFVKANAVCLEGILITHGHFDHVGALEEVRNWFDVPVYHRDMLQEKEYNIGDFTFDVIFTPGHSQDSVTYYFKKDDVMFVGDFVFEGSIGRVDLPGGNLLQMKQSIERIKKYPAGTKLYPGHGPATTLEHEVRSNSYF